MRYVLGRDLRVGDVIEIRWFGVERDQVLTLKPYHGPLAYLWDKDGGARLGSFAVNKVGMTIEPLARFEVLNRPEEKL